MRTQGEVQSLIAAAARPFRTNFRTDRRDIHVDRKSKTVTLPMPAIGMSEEQAEAYLTQVYDAIALARWADESAVLRNKEGELQDPLAYEIGMRRAQAQAIDTWAGDAALYERHFNQLKGELASEDWSALDKEQVKSMAASLAALKNIDLPAIKDIIEHVAPPEVKRLVDKIDPLVLPTDSAKAAEYVRSILEIETQDQQEQEQDQEQEGEGDGDGDTDGTGSGSPDESGDGSGSDKSDGDGEKPAPETSSGGTERPDPTEKLKPKDYKPGEPAIGADGIGEYVCTPDDMVVVFDMVQPERSRNTQYEYELHSVLNDTKGRRHSTECGLELPEHIAKVGESGLSQHIRRLIQVKMRTRYETGKTSGKINRRAVHRLLMPTVGDGMWNAQVFRSKSVPKDTTNTAVCILVDFSGSMQYFKTKTTIEAAGSLNQALTACQVKHAVYTFTEARNNLDTTPGGNGRSLCIGVAKHYDQMQQYEQVMKQMAWLSDWQYQNGDVDAVQWAYHDLLKRREKRKVLIVLSDGYPASDRDGSGETALKNFNRKIESEGKVELYGVGILSEAPKQFYSNSVVVNDLKNLEPQLIALAQGLFDV